MQTLIALSLIALGVVLDATYNAIRRKAEYQAFKDGYRQAQKGEKIRLSAETPHPQFYRPIVNPTTPATKENEKKTEKKKIIPQSFMDELHKTGRAVIKLGGAK